MFRKRNRNKNSAENNIIVPSSYTSSEESELFQVDNFQQQNYFDSDIQTESAIEV